MQILSSYIRDLSILGFWYLQGVLEPVDTKGRLYICFLYPFTSQWAFELLLYFCYWQYCCLLLFNRQIMSDSFVTQ